MTLCILHGKAVSQQISPRECVAAVNATYSDDLSQISVRQQEGSKSKTAYFLGTSTLHRSSSSAASLCGTQRLPHGREPKKRLESPMLPSWHDWDDASEASCRNKVASQQFVIFNGCRTACAVLSLIS